jgi:hypothetical protein
MFRIFKSTFSFVCSTDSKRRSVYKRWPSRVFPAYFKYFIYFGTIEGWAVAQLLEALRYKPQSRRFDCWWDHLIELILAAAILHYVRFSLWQEWVRGISVATCRQPVCLADNLTISCADCLEIDGSPNSCNPRSSFRSLHGFICLFVRTEYITDFMYVRKKIHRMKFNKEFYFYKTISITTNYLKNLKDILIDHSYSFSQMNPSEWIKWIKQIILRYLSAVHTIIYL